MEGGVIFNERFGMVMVWGSYECDIWVGVIGVWLFVDGLEGEIEEGVGGFGKISLINTVGADAEPIMKLRLVVAADVWVLKLLIEKVVNFEFEVFGVDGAVEILECDWFFIIGVGMGEFVVVGVGAELVAGDGADGEVLVVGGEWSHDWYVLYIDGQYFIVDCKMNINDVSLFSFNH